jgi:predicted MFS family arabinose efflux permease
LKVIWDSATHDLILRTVLALCWLIIALFRPPVLLNFLPPRFQEIFFAEKKSLSRLLLLWGVGLFLLSNYLSFGLDRLGYRSSIVVMLSLLIFGAGLSLIFVSLATYIWREVRKRRDS